LIACILYYVKNAEKMESSRKNKTAIVRVLGCKVNQAEAAAMTALLEQKGYCIDSAGKEPDLVLVNTCCVTARAEGKSRRMVNRLAEEFPAALLVVTGCLAEVNASGAHGPRTTVLGTYEKDNLSEYLDSIADMEPAIVKKGSAHCLTFGDLGSPAIRGRSRTFLKIQDGCSQYCSYCIVPTARGPSRSMQPVLAQERAVALDKAGYAEIVLTGIHLGLYGRDLTPRISLERLLEDLLSECKNARFRMSSLEPQEITPRLLELVSEHPRICKHLHIPMQSGDDYILQRMGRPYRTALLLDLFRSIAAGVPDACIGLDVMVGFPGEDEGSFARTRSLIEQSGAAYLHVFPFSPRPGTPAAKFRPRVPGPEALRRVEELRSLSNDLKCAFYERFNGTVRPAVAESLPDAETGSFIMRTDNYIPVQVSGSAVQGIVRVKIEEISGTEVRGSILPEG
jgi:threonylcarbamoyladenosine tRNA methylthiotransferase MtaB